jgi:hypothetical protein
MTHFEQANVVNVLFYRQNGSKKDLGRTLLIYE